MHHLLNDGEIRIKGGKHLSQNVPWVWSLLHETCDIFQLQICDVLLLRWSLVVGTKVWVFLLLSENYMLVENHIPCWSLYESFSENFIKFVSIIGHLWGIGSHVWSKCFGYRAFIDLAAIHCSVHHFGRYAISEGWQALDVEHIYMKCSPCSPVWSDNHPCRSCHMAVSSLYDSEGVGQESDGYQWVDQFW